MAVVADPLTVLPPELVLRILDFTPISTLAFLTAVSRSWHAFIDVTHQDAIYSLPSKTSQPPQQAAGARDLTFLDNATSFAKLFTNVTSWKELCKRQTLLARNWADPRPVTRESVLQVGNNAVWRFKADFKWRFFLSTSHAGGLNVHDMDTGRLLWCLPSVLDSTGEHAVRPYAHLEYQDGMAVLDREGNTLEVWQTHQEGMGRGEFRRTAVIDHDCQIGGFQLSYWTLIVVSTEGQGFVYDVKQDPPALTTHLNIEQDAVGHCDQNEDVVVYSMGTRGYHVYDKRSGESLGTLQPSQCKERYHIHRLPPVDISIQAAALAAIRHDYSQRYFPPKRPSKTRLAPVQIGRGALPNTPSDHDHIRNTEDEWGAGMLDRDSDLFVGFSRAGRVFICSNFREALKNGPTSLATQSQILECESDGSSFDLGGWLSVRNHRIMFEVQDRIYIIALDEDNRIRVEDGEVRPSYALLTSSAPQLAVPVSFMALYDDAIMTTYTTMAQRQQDEEEPGRLYPTKAIRVVSIAPDLDNSDERVLERLRQFSQPTEAVPSQFVLRHYLDTELAWGAGVSAALLDEAPTDEDDELAGLGFPDDDDEWVDEDDIE